MGIRPDIIKVSILEDMDIIAISVKNIEEG